MKETFYPYITIGDRSIVFMGHDRFALLLFLSLSLDIITDKSPQQVCELGKKVFTSVRSVPVMNDIINECLEKSEFISGNENIYIAPLQENLNNTSGINEYRFVYSEGEIESGCIYTNNQRLVFLVG